MSETKKSTFEQQLFKAADKLRKNIDAAEYKYVVLGLVFIKYISETFNELYEKLDADEYSDPEERDEYLAENVFYVPAVARWSHIHNNAKLPSIGETIDEAMEAIEKENKELKNVLPKVYGKANLDKASLGQLIDLISNTELQAENEKSKDLFGRVYEYFLGEFANAEGKKGGQFYTPKAIVKLMVEMIEPYKGRVYDPACGSGGMFVMSEKFVTEHQGNISDITVYGQESNQTTWKLSKMNLAIRNINSQFVSWNTEGSFLKDAHPDLKADFILANPPFNQKDWGIDILQDDARWKLGVPPNGNANYGWMMHMLYHLAPKGVMATVLANGSLSSNTSGEGDLRQRLVEEDMVECMVALPKQMFYNTPIPSCIWFLRREKSNHSKEVLFIDASKMGYMKDRTHRNFTDEDIDIITGTYHSWRKDDSYEDVKGFCKSASISEIQKNNYILTPGRYVGVPYKQDDGISFEDKMDAINFTLINNTKQLKNLNNNISNILNNNFKKQDWTNINFNSNQIIEELTQTIFKEWFGKYQIGDELPEGWRYGKLREISKHVKDSVKPFSHPDKEYRHYSLPAYDNGLNPVIEYGKDIKSNKYLNQSNSFLISKLNPFTPRIWTIFDSDLTDICSTEFQIVKPNKDVLFSLIHCLLNSEYFTSCLSQKVTGTSPSHQRVSPNDIFDVQLIIPDDQTLIHFDDIIKPLLKKKNFNHNIQTLIKTRDTLLPKLMSGQDRVNNIKQTADA